MVVRGEPSREREPTVDISDVDEIIGLAAAHARTEPDTLTLTELADIGAELDIPKASVERAVKVLEERRAAERRAAEAKLARRAKLLMVGTIASGILVVVALLAAWAGHSSLTSSLADVERARSQVDNVVGRRTEVRARLANAQGLDANDRNAELAGADNRVAVEKRRYDEAAAHYNAKASAFPNTAWVRVFGLPARVALSRETSSW